MNRTRVRFAPSPTGGLHLGGVRTALYNYLFAKKNGGDFILRIEDTDQGRFVEGAEEYIIKSLEWCGIKPDEGPHLKGEFGPYRQSERKELYKKYAKQLVASGHAYYAFDTPEEIEALREKLKAEGKANIQYGHHTRLDMRNSLSLSAEETKALLDINFPHVVRLKVPRDEFVSFKDVIRGDLQMDTNSVDDKVLLKADGMPTYHLAVVVDDYLMKITHVFRGEEWLPSAAVHVLLWQYLGWSAAMPDWLHLPLILKPDGNGKLSKRDGERLGFPVFPLGWTDPASGDFLNGFKEEGFIPQAFINMLALLGWSPGTEDEIFSLEDLVNIFSTDRIHAAGAKFDFEKARWFNHEWIHRSTAQDLLPGVLEVFSNNGVNIVDTEKLLSVVEVTKDRCTLLGDFWKQAYYFFQPPANVDIDSITNKWTTGKQEFFYSFLEKIQSIKTVLPTEIESVFKAVAAEKSLKPGELMLPFRIMLVGDKYGPGVFEIAALIGLTETARRIEYCLHHSKL